MSNACTIQLYADNAWHDVAAVSLQGPSGDGWRTPTYSGYAVEWVAARPGARDGHALCASWPVGFEAVALPHWPVFLIDLLAQGHGRRELLQRIGEPATAGAAADWKLLLAGAGNPVGNQRVKQAAEWLQGQDGALRGFTDDEVALRGDDFSEYLASHGLFVAGSSGIQGEWPKVLLTRGKDGLLYLDHTLPDKQAVEHYIVKFGRGSDPQLANILRHEAPYMEIARRLGLRVHAPLELRNRALFIRRFDRRVRAGKVTRLAQESIATLTGMPGFDVVPSHDDVCAALMRHCTKPAAEVLEYIGRDIANIAFGNKDNHARNTAIQRDFSGNIRLTPLYDFAPMYLHPDGIARRIRWQDNDAGAPDWRRVVDRVCELSKQVAAEGHRSGSIIDRRALVAGLQAMASLLLKAMRDASDIGVSTEVITFLRPGVRALADQLAALD